MANYRVFVEKKSPLNTHALALKEKFIQELGVKGLKHLRCLNLYDLFNVEDEQHLAIIKNEILSEVATDAVFDSFEQQHRYFAIEPLPGQFDQRADSAKQCIDLLLNQAVGAENIQVRSGQVFILEGEISDAEFQAIQQFCINPIESQLKDLTILSLPSAQTAQAVPVFEGFTALNHQALRALKEELGLSLTFDDFLLIQDYFKQQGRNPTETEIRVFDTYWSDHCRHSTFETLITNVDFPKTAFGDKVKAVYKDFLQLKENYAPHKKLTLMTMATLMGKVLHEEGKLDNLEISEENNACSLFVDVEVRPFGESDWQTEKWLLMFKNETHNHPTEIEPFGGASTCLGGAIRDPLSGRAYVYQAIRVTGAANPLESQNETLKGKLPQSKICREAAAGYSAYGNQIGIATSLVNEIYHQGYKAKRMEVGAVVGAVPVDQVIRQSPRPKDLILLLGGKTGRDGCGGATGSSKVHKEDAILTSGAEVQKGNAPEERKIQRFFRRPEVSRLIKKCNDFGAGGVCVAIGELADGIRVNLDKVPTKYQGLNGTELAISESQERMAVVIAPQHQEEFLRFAKEENLEATLVAEVTESPMLVLTWQDQVIVEIERAFLDTGGVRQKTAIEVEEIQKSNPFERIVKGETAKEQWQNNLTDLNVASQKGLSEMFDSMIGQGAVLMPYGGRYQMTPIDVSVQKLPMIGKETRTASAITWGFNPEIMNWSCYVGAMHSVAESLAKLVATGVDYRNARLSFQEYFQRLGSNPKVWAKPFLALLGTIEAQRAFEIAAIGGKDSMSGTFQDLHVPPTLISFAVAPTKVEQVISPEFKAPGNYIYLIETPLMADHSLNFNGLRQQFDDVLSEIRQENIISAQVVKIGGVAETLCKMSFGNRIGVKLAENLVLTDGEFFHFKSCAMVVESREPLTFNNVKYLGKTEQTFFIQSQNETLDLLTLQNAWLNKLDPIYPQSTHQKIEIYQQIPAKPLAKPTIATEKFASPRVLISAFYGTNSEYDMQNAFLTTGAKAEILLFRNLKPHWIEESTNALIKALNNSQIFVLPGGFSAGDEPDGSGKFITAVLKNPRIRESIDNFLARGGLILGICNGFQALIKSGLLGSEKMWELSSTSPTLTYNPIGRHISQMVSTRIVNNQSPWLSGFKVGEVFDIPVSHGEGRFYANDEILNRLIANGQVATQYVNLQGEPTNEFCFNPNGSSLAIEGITSACGQILGKMGHSERYSPNTFNNCHGNHDQNLFANGVNYFK